MNVMISRHFKHAISSDIMPETVQSLLVRPMKCITEIIHLGWILWKRSFRLQVV